MYVWVILIGYSRLLKMEDRGYGGVMGVDLMNIVLYTYGIFKE